MNKLYIIGNGFDLHHNLPTTYSDFHNFVIENHSDLQNKLEEYFEFSSNDNYFWKDFENDLGTFNWKSFYNTINQVDVLDENFRPSSIYALEDELEQETETLITEIREAFEDWLTDLDLDSTVRMMSLEEDSIYLNFNYTLTLEEVYQIPIKNITHIHGDVENDLGFLIFGHNQESEISPEFDEDGESTRTSFSDSEGRAQYPFFAFQKPVEEIIKQHHKFFNSLKNVDEVIVLGHSLNSVDMPYIELIKSKISSETRWKVSFFNEDKKEYHLRNLEKIGIKQSHLEFFQMSEYNTIK